MRGFKFHPNTQAFWPNDPQFFPLYDVIAQAGLITPFHSGTTGIGAGMPGGGGVRLKYSNPMAVDDVAAEFPGLDIILAHPSFPWQEEALAVAVHKPNVYIDLSGWSPKYFPEILVQYINTRLRDKMLFGSDYPLITPDRWLADFEKLPIRDEVRPLRAQGERRAAAQAQAVTAPAAPLARRERRRHSPRWAMERGQRRAQRRPPTSGVPFPTREEVLNVRAPRNRRDMRPDSGRARGRRATARCMMTRLLLEVQDEYSRRIYNLSLWSSASCDTSSPSRRN